MNLTAPKRIFVTGGSSPIGSAVVRRLRAEGHDVFAPPRSELDLSDIDSIGKKAGGAWDAIVHMAKTNRAKLNRDMTEALLMADRIAVMKDGEVLQIGTPRQLLNQPEHDYVRDIVEMPKRRADRLEQLMHSS